MQKNHEMTAEMKKKLRLAVKHHQLQLLINFGWSPWQRFINKINTSMNRALLYHNKMLLRSTWTALVGYVVMLKTEKWRNERKNMAVAVAHHRYPPLKDSSYCVTYYFYGTNHSLVLFYITYNLVLVYYHTSTVLSFFCIDGSC